MALSNRHPLHCCPSGIAQQANFQVTHIIAPEANCGIIQPGILYSGAPCGITQQAILYLTHIIAPVALSNRATFNPKYYRPTFLALPKLHL